MAGYFPRFGTEEEEPPSVQPDILGQMQDVRQQQAAALQQHLQFRQGLDQQQQQVEERKGDLDVAGRMLKILDSNVPKGARQFLYKELSAAMGIDPKSERAKDIGAMLMSLEPDALMALRSSFSQQVSGSPPGEVRKMIQAVLRGEVSGDQLIGMTQQVAMRGPPGADREQPEGATPPPESGSLGRAGAAPQVGEQPAPITQRRVQGQGETAPAFQQVNPQLIEALGLDPRVAYRADDLTRAGYSVPPAAADQQKLATQILESSKAANTTLLEAARLHGLVAGRPEVLGVVGGTAENVMGAIDQARGALRLMFPGMTDETDPNAGMIQSGARSVFDKMANWFPTLRETAVDSARVQSSIIGLAYSMAAARGIPENRLTNRIISQHLRELGASGSPEQFTAVLRDTVNRAVEQSTRQANAAVGRSDIPISFRNMTPAEMEVIANNKEILSPNVEAAMRADVERRMSQVPAGEGQAGKVGTDRSRQVARQSPTLEQEQRTEADRTTQQRRGEDRRELREERALQLTEDRERRAARAETRAEDRLQLQEKRERRKEIAEAFSRLSAAISAASKGSGGGSVSIISSPGGDEDASAFRITPAPRRTPPQPGAGGRRKRRSDD